ncbi:hypothetical protein OH77DRAFT_1023911 [Trametes cingulata]|nr:hypothetical protein OH77DRAFT_1023911 [Trametes cingulata]
MAVADAVNSASLRAYAPLASHCSRSLSHVRSRPAVPSCKVAPGVDSLLTRPSLCGRTLWTKEQRSPTKRYAYTLRVFLSSSLSLTCCLVLRPSSAAT